MQKEHKKNAKRTLENNFIKDEDYKILLHDELSCETISLPREQNKLETRGRKEEVIMLNVDTFKNMCMITKTEKAKEIRMYYVKLENIFNKLMKEEMEENKKLLREKEKQLENQKKETEEKENFIKLLTTKPETESFHRNPGYIYIVQDTSKECHYKIGYANDPVARVGNLNTSSSTYSLKILVRYYTCDKEFAEKTIHRALQPFRIKNRKEWFFIKNNTELAYMIYTVRDCIEYTQKYNIQSYDEIENLNINVDEQLMEPVLYRPELSREINKDNVLKEEIKQQNLDKVKYNAQNFLNKTGNYKGCCFSTEKQKWKAELKKDYIITFLGYYDSEVDAAKAYNDYALYLNKTCDTNYSLNTIDGYIENPRDVVADNKKIILENKKSYYHGVSYDSQRKYYVSSIKYETKSYYLGHNENEIECAKLYNQQALYFNNHLNTKYVLNEISDYITIEKNIYNENQASKISNKSSKYYGVTFNKKSNKYRSCLVYNKKQIHIGSFSDELEAAKAYNSKAIQFNNMYNTHYKINIIPTPY